MNPYEPPQPSERSLEERIERLEAKLCDSKPAGFAVSALAVLLIMAAGAMLGWVAMRVGR